MLTRTGSEGRQARFLQRMGERGVTVAAISDPRDIYWLTGFLPERYPAFFLLRSDGTSLLAAHTMDGEALATERVAYEPHILFTTNPDPVRRLVAVVREALQGRAGTGTIGWQEEATQRSMAQMLAETLAPDGWVAIDDDLAALEKRKDPDEVALIRTSVDCTQAAYDAARAAIIPGASELSVLEAGHSAATLRAKETVFHSGDYQSGEGGGFARDRAIQGGELYVIDAWTVYRGYWSDLCRTFAVTNPTPLQSELFNLVANILGEAPSHLQPGNRGTDVWKWIDGRLREHPALRDTGLVHHAGHGTGLRPHEAPDLNRDREGILEVGDVVCVEPGVYLPELRAGIRLENMFLITERGAERLSDYPVTIR